MLLQNLPNRNQTITKMGDRQKLKSGFDQTPCERKWRKTSRLLRTFSSLEALSEIPLLYLSWAVVSLLLCVVCLIIVISTLWYHNYSCACFSDQYYFDIGCIDIKSLPG